MTNQAVLRVAVGKVHGAAVRAGRGASSNRRVSHRHLKVLTSTIFSVSGANVSSAAVVQVAAAAGPDAVACSGR